MKKLILAFFIYFISLSSSFGDGIKGVYACSSGINNDKPITYMFNSNLMIRDKVEEFPFELITSFNTGELLYVGLTKGEKFDDYIKYNGGNKEALDWFSKQFLRGSAFNFTPQNKNEYLLRLALSCQIEDYSSIALQSFKRTFKVTSYYNEVLKNDKSDNLYFSSLKSGPLEKDICEISNQFLKDNKIVSIEEYFIRENLRKILAMEGAIRKTLISINLKNETIWETMIDTEIKPKKYNCTTIDLEVPKIKTPDNSFIKEIT